jgi:glycosyltransferase involved in cell wall biosynthesis
MTRILIATDNHPPRWDGISRFLTEIIPRLDHHITVVSPDYGQYEIDNAEHIKLPTTSHTVGDYPVPKPSLAAIKDLVQQADLVFGQTIGPIGSTAGHYARRTTTPLIHYTHSIEWQLLPKATDQHILKRLTKQATRWYSQWYYNRTDHLITPSRAIQETLHYEGITTKTSTAALGVNHDQFKPVDELTNAQTTQVKTYRDRLTDDDNTLIGYHGRLAREKDLFTLLRAVKRLKKQRDDFHVVIIGDGLVTIRDRFEADDHCTVLPAQTDIHRYVQALDVYVTTTLTETTSLSTAEAMACGKPVIATPAGYIEDYIEHGSNGYLIDFKDHYSLSALLNELIDHKDRRRRIGREAHKTAKQVFNWDTTAERINGVLDDHT